MDWNRIEGNWKLFRGKVKERWGQLTDDELDVIAGKRDQLIGRIEEAYGIAREDAERDVAEFARALDASATASAPGRGGAPRATR